MARLVPKEEKPKKKKKPGPKPKPKPSPDDPCKKCGQVHKRCKGHKNRKRTGGKWQPCMAWPVKDQLGNVINGNCRFCNGNPVRGLAHPNAKHLRKAKYEFLPKHIHERLEIFQDAIENLEHSLQVQISLETTLLEKLNTNESGLAWNSLQKAVNDYLKAQYSSQPAKKRDEKMRKAFGDIARIVNEGASESALYNEIQQVHENQRRLTETLYRVRKEDQEIYTADEWFVFLDYIIKVIADNVTDRKQIGRIQDALRVAAPQAKSGSKLLTEGAG